MNTFLDLGIKFFSSATQSHLQPSLVTKRISKLNTKRISKLKHEPYADDDADDYYYGYGDEKIEIDGEYY